MGLAEGFRTGMAFAELRERRERQAQTNADNAMDSWAAVSAAMTPAAARDESNFEINIMETTMQNLTDFTRSIEADKNQSIQADRLIKELENTFGAALPETIRDTLKKGKKDDLSDMVEHLNFESIAQSYGLEMFKNIFTDANAFAEMEKRQLTSRGNRTLDNPSARKKLRNLKLRQRKYMEVSNKVLQGMRDRAQEIENTYGKTPSLTAYADYFRERTERMDQFNQRIDAVEKEIRAPEAAAATAFAQIGPRVLEQRALLSGELNKAAQLGAQQGRQSLSDLEAKYRLQAGLSGLPVRDVARFDISRNVAEGVLTRGEREEMRSGGVSTEAFIQDTQDLLLLLEQNPDAATVAARGAGIATSLAQEARAVARVAGVDFDENTLNPDVYDSKFKELGIDNARVRSMITNLAWARAATHGEKGRVSNRDVERFIEELGSSSDPSIFASTLLDVAKRVVRRHKIEVRRKTGKAPEEDFGLSQLEEIVGRVRGKREQKKGKGEFIIKEIKP